ncbi:Hypothetical predicted protein [Paramuricea clavata]|uniref:Uncharacterized protein n=1 Tax=Paramuricea clavata TaxID=317549 RepID=A0A6S7I987_PARCT|nr:Hypothetical predicted protein [Paramuricea clavata]
MEQADYVKLLKGGGTPYKGTKLFTLKGKASTVEERAAGKICPPPQLNPNYAPNTKIPRVGIALGMALPMLLNTGTSVVGSIFGKKPARKPTQSMNNQGGHRPEPSWMQDRPPPRRRRRPRYYDDYY